MSVLRNVVFNPTANQLELEHDDGTYTYVSMRNPNQQATPVTGAWYDVIDKTLNLTHVDGNSTPVLLANPLDDKADEMVQTARDCLNDTAFGPRLSAQIVAKEWMEVGLTLEAYKQATEEPF